MESLIISKQNESFLQIECERSVEQELSEHFCFFVPGYRFMPAYKNRIWDGKIRLFNSRSRTIYSGLIPYIKKFCGEREYKLDISPDVNITHSLSLVEAVEFLKPLYKIIC